MSLSTPARVIDYTHFAEVEASYGDITATPAAGDAYRCRARNLGFVREVNRLDRDKDTDRSASTHTTAVGRKRASFKVPAALAPSGVTGTPTAPDMGEFFRSHFGTQDVAAGHSTCTSGSTTTVVQGTSGAVTALSLAVGDWVIPTTTAGIEARIASSISTDAITVDRALSSAPTNASALYGAVSYRLSKNTILSMIDYGYLDGDFEHLCAGMLISDMEITYELLGDNSEPMVTFSGPAARIATLATSIPTPTLQTARGIGPQDAWAWIGATKTCLTKLSLKSNNGLELREDSCSRYPTGGKRTGNDGRYKIELELEVRNTGTQGEGFYDNFELLQNYDIIVQIGTTLGNSFAFRVPNFIPDVDESEVQGEAGLVLKGRCYGNGTDDTELTCCFF